MKKTYKNNPINPMTTGPEDVYYNNKKINNHKPFIVNDSQNIQDWEKVMMALHRKISNSEIDYNYIAAVSDIAQPNISRTLRGKKLPKLDTFLKIATAVDPDFLDKIINALE